jgi:hypothetical protein
MSKEQERTALRRQAAYCDHALRAIRMRIQDLEPLERSEHEPT